MSVTAADQTDAIEGVSGIERDDGIRIVSQKNDGLMSRPESGKTRCAAGDIVAAEDIEHIVAPRLIAEEAEPALFKQLVPQADRNPFLASFPVPGNGEADRSGRGENLQQFG